ncbi:MAG: hypothetical protein MI974_08110 [Chitinophagales bacterium]|nr:hypothetical protein [Chitinophagales bacterium]
MKNLYLLFLMAFFVLFNSCEQEDIKLEDVVLEEATDNTPEEEEENPSTEAMVYYELELQGETWIPFSRTACLLVAKDIDAAPTSNGVNPYDIAIASGSPGAVPEAGAIHYLTNTTLCQYTNSGCNSTPINAAIDAAFVSVSNNPKRIDIEIDGQVLGNGTAGTVILQNWLSNFNAYSGLGANIYQISTGEISITFSADEKTITGTISIVGGNFTGTGTAPYNATFTGSKVDQNCF